MNFAAESHVDRSIEGAAPFIRTNVVGTLTLLEAARRIDGCRFVQISTDEVYGALELDEPRQFLETDPLAPNSPYAASKAGADLLVRSFVRTYGLAGRRHALLEQLRPLPVPGEVHPADDPARARGGEAADLRRRPLRAGLDPRRGPLPRRARRARARGRPGRSTTSAGGPSGPTSTSRGESSRKRGSPPGGSSTWPTGEGTTAATPSGKGSSGRQLGWAPAHDFEQGLSGTIAWYRAHEILVAADHQRGLPRGPPERGAPEEAVRVHRGRDAGAPDVAVEGAPARDSAVPSDAAVGDGRPGSWDGALHRPAVVAGARSPALCWNSASSGGLGEHGYENEIGDPAVRSGRRRAADSRRRSRPSRASPGTSVPTAATIPAAVS